jgi:hypothetical protein
MFDLQDIHGHWRLLRFAAACIVLIGIALNLHAEANGDAGRNLGSVAVAVAGPGFGLDRYHAAMGHDGGQHCSPGAHCGSAVALPDAAAVRIARQMRMRTRTDLLARHRTIRPPLHPPNPTVRA